MITTTETDVASIASLGHREAMQLQRTELDRAIAQLGTLEPGDWSTSTVCPGWDVRTMWLHVLGACEAGASVRENVHQMRAARRRAREQNLSLEAALSAIQIEDRSELSPDELVGRLGPVIPKTIGGRRRVPRPLRAIKVAVDAPVVEKWSLGYLIDVIYLRDIWMHRIDTARATGRDLELSADHDGRIVANIVAEWGRRHGQPFDLVLTGPAGGVFTAGTGGESIELDAIEFCCRLAGRGEATGLLRTIVPF